MHIFITGASSGIGASLARRLGANPHHHLTLVARRQHKLEELAAELEATVSIIPGDLSDPARAQDIVDRAVDHAGPIDCLINNAGMNRFEHAHAMEHTKAATLFNLNVLSPMALVEATYPSMRERSQGSIVNIASVAAVNTPHGMAHYSATKAALAKYSEALHTEARAHGIHVLTVYPGPVATDMEASARRSFGGSLGKADKLPLGTPDELAEKIERGMRLKKRKLTYPKFYQSAFVLPALTQCLTERFSPQLR